MRFTSNTTSGQLFLGFSGTEGKLLDTATGGVAANFTYGHIESDTEALKRKQKYRLRACLETQFLTQR
jgi:hypothetical protein